MPHHVAAVLIGSMTAAPWCCGRGCTHACVCRCWLSCSTPALPGRGPIFRLFTGRLLLLLQGGKTPLPDAAFKERLEVAKECLQKVQVLLDAAPVSAADKVHPHPFISTFCSTAHGLLHCGKVGNCQARAWNLMGTCQPDKAMVFGLDEELVGGDAGWFGRHSSRNCGWEGGGCWVDDGEFTQGTG